MSQDDRTPDEPRDEPTQPLTGWRPSEEPRPGPDSQGEVLQHRTEGTEHPSPAQTGPEQHQAPEHQQVPGQHQAPEHQQVPEHRAPEAARGQHPDPEQQAREQHQVPPQAHARPVQPGSYQAQPPAPGWDRNDPRAPAVPPGPAPFGPPHPDPRTQALPQPYGAYPWPPPAPRRADRGLSVWTWLGVAALALVLGLIGGIAGVTLALPEESGTVSGGLGGVSTRDVAPLDAKNGSVPAVAQALLPSTVQILAAFDGEDGGATGSGFVLDREGHVVTNNHVVASAAKDDGEIVVIDHEGGRHPATVVGRSPVYDIAVLLLEDPQGLEPAALGASRGLRVGDQVVAFGAPLGLDQTVTSGIVSALNRPVTTSGESDDETSYINAVQTDAAINPGNSGGPLVNLKGEVVGVNSAIATTGGVIGGESGNIGVGFAIPIEQVQTTVDQILRTGRARYPIIGAQVRTGGERGGTGAEITEVTPDSPAERAGLRKDDLVLAVDGEPVNDGISLIVAIRTHVPGDRIELTVERDGEEKGFTLELDGQVG